MTSKTSGDRRDAAARVADLYVGTTNGRLFVRVWGERDRWSAVAPIILFHDSLGSVELWRDFPAVLAIETARPVVAYDRLGFGRSDPHPGTLGPDFIRREADTSLPALRTALELERMILFGHSVGGAMAIVSAAEFPEATAAVITESAQAFVEDRTLAGIREAKSAFEAPDQLERLARYHKEKASWVLDAWTGTWLTPRFAAWTLDDDLRRLRCPVLAIHGDRDEYGSRAHPERIAALAAAGAEVVMLEDCGHVPHREKPERVLEAASTFIKSVDGEARPAS